MDKAGEALRQDPQGRPFSPIADAKKMIERDALPYRERPSGVLRELLQNASDASLDRPIGDRFVEVAILAKPDAPPPNGFHLTIRDVGSGMTEDELANRLGILGVSEMSQPHAIGEYGIGFFSTHAICDEVLIISRKDGHEMTAWRYVPSELMFYPCQPDRLKNLLQTDFAAHPRPMRQRSAGTSVYLRLETDKYPTCLDWLQPPSLIRDLSRDMIILPTEIYVGNYADGPTSGPVNDMNGNDVADVSVSMPHPPWELVGDDAARAAAKLFTHAFPTTDAATHPKAWGIFETSVGAGKLEGLLFVPQAMPSRAYAEVFVKRMRVESAQDLLPHWAGPIMAYVNMTPDTGSFAVHVRPTCDQVVRTPPFFMAVDAMEEAALDFVAHKTDDLIGKIEAAVHGCPDPEAICQPVSEVLKESSILPLLGRLTKHYDSLLRDVPRLLSDILSEPDCPETLSSAIGAFVNDLLRKIPIPSQALPAVLSDMQKHADRRHRLERAAQAETRQAPTWNPEVARRFFARLGSYLPVRVFYRENIPGGGFRAREVVIPLRAIRILDPGDGMHVRVLTAGSPEDFLGRNPSIRCVVHPEDPSTLLGLALAAHLNPGELTLEFVSHTKKLFENLTVRDDWEPLVEVFRAFVSGPAPHIDSQSQTEVEARGYIIDTVPIVSTVEKSKTIVVLNGYNRLLQGVLERYRRALQHNDMETRDLMLAMCHELYHGSIPAQLEGGDPRTRHDTETRNGLMEAVLSLLDKYRDLKDQS